MTIIEEVGSPVAATVVVMVVIDIDGSVSSSRCDLQHQWCCKYTTAKDLTIHRQGTCSIRFNGAIHRTGNYYCFIQLVDSTLSRSGMHSISLLQSYQQTSTYLPLVAITLLKTKQESILTTVDKLFRMEFIKKTYCTVTVLLRMFEPFHKENHVTYCTVLYCTLYCTVSRVYAQTSKSGRSYGKPEAGASGSTSNFTSSTQDLAKSKSDVDSYKTCRCQ